MKTIFYALPFLFFSCYSPKKIIRINALDDKNVSWLYGTDIQEVEKDSLLASANFEDYTDQYLIFHLTLNYTGKIPVLYHPYNTYILDGKDKKILCLDPESEILLNQVDINKLESRRKNMTIFAPIAGVAMAIAIGSILDNPGGSTAVQPVNTTYIYNTPQISSSGNKPGSQSFWKNHALRKTTLKENYLIEGLIVFPRTDHLSDFSLAIEIGDTVIKFPFRQRIFTP